MAHHLRRLMCALPALRAAAATQGEESIIVAVGPGQAPASGRRGHADVVLVRDTRS